jgi:hypothetical protein
LILTKSFLGRNALIELGEKSMVQVCVLGQEIFQDGLGGWIGVVFRHAVRLLLLIGVVLLRNGVSVVGAFSTRFQAFWMLE